MAKKIMGMSLTKELVIGGAIVGVLGVALYMLNKSNANATNSAAPTASNTTSTSVTTTTPASGTTPAAGTTTVSTPAGSVSVTTTPPASS